MISMKFRNICLPAVVALCLLRVDLVFSQEVSSLPGPAAEIAADVESPYPVERDGTGENEALASIQKTWQRELQVAARGELVFARMACGLNADNTDALWKAIQPRLQSMNDLILFESGEMGVVEVVLEEVNVLGVDIQLEKPANDNVPDGDEARRMEMELDQLQLEEAFIDATIATAYTGDGIALKANPYTRLRQEFREALKSMVSPEQLDRYDQENSDRDQFRRNATMNAIMGNLLKSLQLEPEQEKSLRLALANGMTQLDDLEISSYLYDVNVIPQMADAEIKRLLTVRQRAKWNNLTVYNYPIQMPYVDSETDEDD